MKHYIVYTILSLCIFYLGIGEMDRMSRATEFISTSYRVKDVISS